MAWYCYPEELKNFKEEQETRDKAGEEVVNKLCFQLNELQGKVKYIDVLPGF